VSQVALPPLPPKTKKGRRNLVRDIIEVLLLAVAIYLVIAFALQTVRVEGESMVPTLQNGDLLFANKISYHFHGPDRGDIVVLIPPETPDRDFIKRVIGLPGDVVEARDGHVYVNGRLLLEPYLPKGEVTADFGPVVVPPGRLWVLGDNRGDSCDSRCFPEGAIPESSVIGRAVFRVWPVGHISFL